MNRRRAAVAGEEFAGRKLPDHVLGVFGFERRHTQGDIFINLHADAPHT